MGSLINTPTLKINGQERYSHLNISLSSHPVMRYQKSTPINININEFSSDSCESRIMTKLSVIKSAHKSVRMFAKGGRPIRKSDVGSNYKVLITLS